MSLAALFTDIADAIREKDGTQEDITASAFPERIRAILTGGKKEWQLLIDKTLDEDEAVNTGSLPDVTEMLFLYAAPATEQVISSGTETKAFGAWAPYYVNLTHATYPTSGMIYSMKVGGSAISFYRFNQTTNIGIDNAPRVASNVQCSQTGSSNNVPFTSAVLPAGTIIRLYVR